MIWTNDWSIWISPEIGMDQWRSKSSESFSLDRHWSIECSSLFWGGNFWQTFRPLVHTDFPENKAPSGWSMRISPEFIWTNGSQISLKVLVYTGIGPWSALLWPSSSQPIICQTHQVHCRTQRLWCRTHWVLSFESRESLKTVSWNRRPPQEGSIEPLQRFYRTPKVLSNPLLAPEKVL